MIVTGQAALFLHAYTMVRICQEAPELAARVPVKEYPLPEGGTVALGGNQFYISGYALLALFLQGMTGGNGPRFSFE